MQIADLPAVNATLNSLSAVLLACGYYFIRQKRIAVHRICMLSALTTSTLFFISYLTYHYHTGSKHFAGVGVIRMVYFAILTSHTILAVVIVPMALITLFRALKQRFDKHKRIARWTLPLWFYVSVTGVIIYWMLYQM
jgi:putative membrane protein